VAEETFEPPIGVNMLERFRSFIADAAAAAAQVSGDLNVALTFTLDIVSFTLTLDLDVVLCCDSDIGT